MQVKLQNPRQITCHCKSGSGFCWQPLVRGPDPTVRYGIEGPGTSGTEVNTVNTTMGGGTPGKTFPRGSSGAKYTSLHARLADSRRQGTMLNSSPTAAEPKKHEVCIAVTSKVAHQNWKVSQSNDATNRGNAGTSGIAVQPVLKLPWIVRTTRALHGCLSCSIKHRCSREPLPPCLHCLAHQCP